MNKHLLAKKQTRYNKYKVQKFLASLTGEKLVKIKDLRVGFLFFGVTPTILYFIITQKRLWLSCF